jgi:myo-inositol catabolism protein IolS
MARRVLTAGGALVGLLAAIVFGRAWQELRRTRYQSPAEFPRRAPETLAGVAGMPYRRFGATGLSVSELGFGGWALGGRAYGTVDRQESLRALARAEELGCNLVDTAMIYGDSELVLGEFLRGRRSRWIVATKYSYQREGLRATLEAQLQRLGTDVIDFYQLHWPSADPRVYEELWAARKAGKVRFLGASLYSAHEIDALIDRAQIDGVQLSFSLLDPDPFLLRIERLRASGLAIVIRSALKEGFLTGKFRRDATFPDANDQRHRWSPHRVARTVGQVERLRFLESDAGSLLRAAVAYPLSFPEVSTVLLGTKTAAQAGENFGQTAGARLGIASLQRIARLQDELDAGGRRTLMGRVRRAQGL